MERKNPDELFNLYYNEHSKKCSDIMQKHMVNGLKEMYELTGSPIAYSDLYRCFSYQVIATLVENSEKAISKEDKDIAINKSLEIIDKLLEEYKDNENSREIIYLIAPMIMDMLAFREFEYSLYSKEKEKTDE